MAWGIIATGVTLLGMLALVMASVQMNDATTGEAFHEDTGPASSPAGSQCSCQTDSAAEPAAHKIAA